MAECETVFADSDREVIEYARQAIHDALRCHRCALCNAATEELEQAERGLESLLAGFDIGRLSRSRHAIRCANDEARDA